MPVTYQRVSALAPPEAGWVSDWLGRVGLKTVPPSSTADLAIELRIDEQLALPPHTSEPSPEDLQITIDVDTTPHTVAVSARSATGLRRSTALLERGVREHEWPPNNVTQRPQFTKRGLLEGFYGPPWETSTRTRMVLECADLGLTHFMTAPKDAADQRANWRSPLSTAQATELERLVVLADREHISLVCAVSPGLTLRYSDDSDFDALIARFEQFHALGVRHGALLLDDIPDTLSDPGDVSQYTDIAAAHADLADRWARLLWQQDAAWSLSICPMVYCGVGDESYLQTVAGRTPAPVDIMWTGRDICSRRLELLDGATFWRTTNRPPLWWDNYPVNDLAMRSRLHLGPLQGRDRHLHRVSAGLYANAMDLPESTRIALGTIAEYTWDPEGYDPEAAWRRSIRRVAGKEWEAMLAFADNVRTSCLTEWDSPALSRALGDAWLRQQAGDTTTALAIVANLADQIERTADILLAPDVDNLTLATEIRPWVIEYRSGAADLRAGASVATSEHLLARRRLVGAARPQVFGDVLDMYLTERGATSNPPSTVRSHED